MTAQQHRNRLMAPAAAKPYRVPSLDGGGIRGSYTVAFLDRLVSQSARLHSVDGLDLGKTTHGGT